jgi:hypothetical protein
MHDRGQLRLTYVKPFLRPFAAIEVEIVSQCPHEGFRIAKTSLHRRADRPPVSIPSASTW